MSRRGQEVKKVGRMRDVKMDTMMLRFKAFIQKSAASFLTSYLAPASCRISCHSPFLLLALTLGPKVQARVAKEPMADLY